MGEDPKTQEDSPSNTPVHGSDGVDPLRRGPLVRGLTLLMANAMFNCRFTLFERGSAKLMSLLHLHLKVKPWGDLTEAKTLLYVASHTSIPVPRVYCAFCHRGKSFILMKKLPGNMAGRAWGQRTDASKAKVLEQIRHMVDELRSVAPPPSGKVASVVDGRIYDLRLPSKNFWGPYPSVQAFHEALIRVDKLPDDCTRLPQDMAEMIEFMRNASPVPVLTHGDLCSQNIMVQGDTVVGIIDWETAGWLPSYWESVNAWHTNPQNQFWQDEAGKFVTIDPHSLEMDRVRRKYFGDY